MTAAHINHEEFKKLLESSKPVLVDYQAPWCVYCRRLDAAYDQIAEQYGEHMHVVRINIDENAALAQQEGIEMVPTFALYEKGRRIASAVAPASKTEIEDFLTHTLPAAKMETSEPVHDMVIIGGGPGGYTAALYAARAGLNTVLLEKLSAGGQMAQTHQVENYPGFPDGIEGFELAQHMQQQAERFGAHPVNGEVLRVDLVASPKRIETTEGIFYARTVVIATGANPRRLGLAEEETLLGRGVAYCAACDGMFYRGKTVAVVGGGDTAAADALLLSRIAKKVIVIHRRNTLRATKIYHQLLMDAPNVEFRWNSVVTELLHGDKVTGVRIRDVQNGKEAELDCDGVFVSVGRVPASDLVRGQVELDTGGYLIAGEDTRTSLPGVYAVGDVRTKALRQVVTAVADGAMAVHSAEEYLAGQA